MYEFATIEPEFNQEEKVQDNIQIDGLEVKNLSFRFVGREALLEHISFDLKKGEILALLGENG